MNRIVPIALTTALLFLLCGELAAETRVTIRADRLRYLSDQEVVQAEGVDSLEYGEVVITADYIELDTAADRISARGNVTFSGKDHYILAEEFEHYLDTDYSIFLEVRSRLESEGVEEPLHFYTPKMREQKGEITILSGELTTCELDHPHYFFRASEVTIYPNDRLVANHVVFWELDGRLPLFYWPRLIISLEHEQPRFIPSFGYSEQKGYFIKTTYNYFRTSSRGSIYADYFTRRGVGGGLKHIYADTEHKEGHFSFYFLQDQEGDRDWDHLTADLKHSQDFGYWRGELELDYHFDPGIMQEAQAALSASHAASEQTTHLETGYSLKRDLQDAEFEERVTSTVSHDRDLAANWQLELRGEHDHLWEDDETRRTITGRTSLLRRTNPYSLELSLERDQSPVTVSDPDPPFIRMPEISMTMYPGRIFNLRSPVDDLIAPLRLKTAAGRYLEGEMELLRSRNSFDISRRFHPLNEFTLRAGQKGSASMYLPVPDMEQSSLYLTSESQLTAQAEITENLNLDTRYRYHTDLGATPLLYDRISTPHDIRSSLVHTGHLHQIRLRGGYDIQEGSYDSLRGNMSFFPLPWLTADLATSYDLEAGQFEGLVQRTQIERDTVELDLALRADEDWQLERIDSRLSLTIDDRWRLELKGRYDPERQEIDRGELVLVRDLHCREISLSYNHQDQAIWFEYHILAFPEQRAGLGWTPEEPMLFDLELGDLFDEE